MTYCGCGCKKIAPVGKTYILGHWSRTEEAKKMFLRQRKQKHIKGNVSSLCKCGCGENTPLSKDNRPERGYYKGQHLFYVPGHHMRQRTGPLASGWKGGRYVNSMGYVRIYRPEHPFADKDGHVLEHRLVMEKKLGRYLKPWEKVHHVNGNKTDNRRKNLVVTSQADHMREHSPWKYKKNASEQASKAGRKGAEARWGKRKPK